MDSKENSNDTSLTAKRYLQAKVNATISEDTLMAVMADRGINPEAEYADLTEKDRDLCLADLYVYLSLQPTQTEKKTDTDADWSHSEGGTVYSANVLNGYLRLANAIYAKYGLTQVGSNKWGMRGGGFCNIRNYGDRLMR